MSPPADAQTQTSLAQTQMKLLRSVRGAALASNLRQPLAQAVLASA